MGPPPLEELRATFFLSTTLRRTAHFDITKVQVFKVEPGKLAWQAGEYTEEKYKAKSSHISLGWLTTVDRCLGWHGRISVKVYDKTSEDLLLKIGLCRITVVHVASTTIPGTFQWTLILALLRGSPSHQSNG